MTLVAAPSAHAATRPSDARIAFVRSGDIWTIRPDGKGLRRVTHTPDNLPGPLSIADSEPTWSPNGRWIAFVRTVSDRGPDLPPRRIYVVRPNGRGLRFVTEGRSPTWFPDGERIAFEGVGVRSPDGGWAAGAYSVRLDGTDKRVIRECVVPPDAPDDETSWCLEAYFYDLAVSPDGNRIAWSVQRVYDLDVEVLDMVSGASTWIVGPDAPQVIIKPDWSPDGGWLAVTAEAIAGRAWVAIVRPDGTGWRLVTPFTRRGYDQYEWGEASWAPRGARLVLAGSRQQRIFIVRRNGTHKRFLTRGAEPDWQPLPLPPTEPAQGLACRATPCP